MLHSTVLGQTALTQSIQPCASRTRTRSTRCQTSGMQSWAWMACSLTRRPVTLAILLQKEWRSRAAITLRTFSAPGGSLPTPAAPQAALCSLQVVTQDLFVRHTLRIASSPRPRHGSATAPSVRSGRRRRAAVATLVRLTTHPTFVLPTRKSTQGTKLASQTSALRRMLSCSGSCVEFRALRSSPWKHLKTSRSWEVSSSHLWLLASSLVWLLFSWSMVRHRISSLLVAHCHSTCALRRLGPSCSTPRVLLATWTWATRTIGGMEPCFPLAWASHLS
mmetsp:Transcript_12284/g.28723  ORF Transcript_12284/g.28723 Transcript_12284/m.28723 type:complete len:277 (-) Transcript_12284:1811-2641(-)